MRSESKILAGKGRALLVVNPCAGRTKGRLYADLLGKGGRSLLEAHGIPVRFGALAERIINRAGTDLCPMEKATEEISDPEEAERALRKKLEELRSGPL